MKALKFLGYPLILLLCLASLQGQEGFHIDTSQVVKDLDGKPLPINSEGQLPASATFGRIAKDALTNTLPGDDKIEGSVKYDHWMLAAKVYPDRKDAVLTRTELETIRDRVGKGYGAIVVGPVWRLIDAALAKEGAVKPKEGSK
jgi:hypothetical protein